MKKITCLLLLSILFCAFNANSTKYQIKVLNTPSIRINNKNLKVNDWFDDSSNISWSSAKQAMKVLSSDNKTYYVLAEDYLKIKPTSFNQFLIAQKSASTRHSLFFPSMTEFFEDDFILLDQLEIDLTDLDLEEGTGFQIYDPSNEDFKVNLPVEGGILKIHREDVEKAFADSESLNFGVRCFFPGETFYEPVTEFFTIRLIPLSLE